MARTEEKMEGETEADTGAGGVACLRPVLISARIMMITEMVVVKSGISEKIFSSGILNSRLTLK
jgi:hypothetical protein